MAIVNGSAAGNFSRRERPLDFGGGLIEWTVVMNGYLVPPLLIFTLIINILFCIILLKPNMRSPTNVLLLAMAVSDTLTGLSPLPFYLYVYTFGNYKEWTPYYLCDFFNVIKRALPTIFHTASIWLTVALATQRYVFVCHSIVAKKWCTINNMLKVIVIIYVVSTIVHITTFIDTYHTSIETMSRLENRTMISCLSKQTKWFSDNQTVFYNVYIWFRIIFIHTVPCTSLVVVNFLLIRTMREAKRRRAQLLQQNKKSESRRVKDSNSTTQMMILVVGVFLIVEIPSALYLIIYAILNSIGTAMEPRANAASTLLLNFIILLSYPVTFFIYCGMSKQFRDNFKQLFSPKSPTAGDDREPTHYTTLPNGNDHCVTSAHHSPHNAADTAL